MKYFTPELYTRLQAADESAMDEADAAWQCAEEQYQRRLKSIRLQLPASALKILDQARLHDAEVLWIGQAVPVFAMLLRLDPPARTTLVLSYFVTRPVQFETDALAPEAGIPVMQWFYDEVDLGSQPGRFKHSVLFSNGCHLDLEATEMQIATVDTLYVPAPARSLSA